MAIEKWVFFIVPHLLWHGASVYNSHLQGPVTLAPIADRLAVLLPVFTTYVWRGWDLNTQSSPCDANALTNCTTAAVIPVWICNLALCKVASLCACNCVYVPISVVFICLCYTACLRKCVWCCVFVTACRWKLMSYKIESKAQSLLEMFLKLVIIDVETIGVVIWEIF